MYLPRGFYSDIGDVEVIAHKGTLHMFHLVLPNRDLVGHAVSKDGLSWRACKAAITTGAPGACDDDMIRTVSVTERNGSFYMLYTAVCRAEAGRVERAALAISTDLYNWEKQPDGAAIQADPAYYEAELTATRGTAFRDPKPFEEAGRYTCLVCARTNQGPRFRRGCAARFVSGDLIHWESRPPLFAPGLFDELECPQLYRIGSYYYLFASIIEERIQRYWVSSSIDGPYITPKNSTQLAPYGHYAGRICRFGKRDIFACWTSCVQDGEHPYGLRTVLGEYIRYVPAILEVVQEGDGTLHLVSSANWSAYQGPTLPLLDTLEQTVGGAASALSGSGHSTLAAYDSTGYAQYATKEGCGSFTLTGDIQITGVEGGLLFRGDNDTGGYFIRLMPAMHQVELLVHLREELTDRFQYRVLQTAHFAFEERAALPFILRSVGAEIEFSLGGQVLLATVSATRTSGKLGLYTLCGDTTLSKIALCAMEEPLNL